MLLALQMYKPVSDTWNTEDTQTWKTLWLSGYDLILHDIPTHLCFFNFQGLSIGEDAKVGGLCDKASVLVPGYCGWRNGIRQTLQSDRVPNMHTDYYGRVTSAVPDAWRNCRIDEKFTSYIKDINVMCSGDFGGQQNYRAEHGQNAVTAESKTKIQNVF